MFIFLKSWKPRKNDTLELFRAWEMTQQLECALQVLQVEGLGRKTKIPCWVQMSWNCMNEYKFCTCEIYAVGTTNRDFPDQLDETRVLRWRPPAPAEALDESLNGVGLRSPESPDWEADWLGPSGTREPLGEAADELLLYMFYLHGELSEILLWIWCCVRKTVIIITLKMNIN